MMARRDINEAAHQTVQAVLDRTEPARPKKNLAAVALGRLGGLKGGKARAARLTPEQRRAIAKKAASARWVKRGESETDQPVAIAESKPPAASHQPAESLPRGHPTIK